ncbi:hypothetical protein F5Y08DRAFT_216238 [Xylaria arbuscula]|nr:hypothetical protein F5Y08DRAFT_216238 [Xylaria arbuscula]
MVSSHANSPKPDSSKHATTSSSKAATFTPEMRDRQARGKDPYHSDSEDSDWAPGQTSGQGNGSGPARSGKYKRDEPFNAAERRRMAAQLLGSPELLMMAAIRDKESVPATRLKYKHILCGMEDSVTTRKGTAAAAAAERQRKRPNPEQK